MDVSLLGQFKFDGNWVEIIIVLLVIGGSVFGPISKKLIEAFSPKDSDKAEGPSGDPTGQPKPLAPPRPHVRPGQRVARPLPLPPRTAPARPAAHERGMLPASPAIETPEQALGPWTEMAPARPRPKRPAESTFVPTPEVSAPATAEGRLGHLESNLERTGGLEEVATEKGLGLLESAIADRGDELDEAVAGRLGHVDPGAWAQPATAGKRLTIPGIGRATPRALRQAILLREILGPPVSLQPPADSF